jgi:hypothetical protein
LHINGFKLGWCRFCESEKITSIDFLLLIIDYDDFVAKGGVGLGITNKLTKEGKTFRKKFWQ